MDVSLEIFVYESAYFPHLYLERERERERETCRAPYPAHSLSLSRCHFSCCPLISSPRLEKKETSLCDFGGQVEEGDTQYETTDGMKQAGDEKEEATNSVQPQLSISQFSLVF